MKLLNLFSGTDSVAIPWREAGHEVISVDIDPRYNPEICEDILQLSYCKLPTPQIIWCSPPCDQYARCRTRAKRTRNLALADSLVAKTIEIISYFQKAAMLSDTHSAGGAENIQLADQHVNCLLQINGNR